MVEVTQEDLDAAADLIESYWSRADANMMRLAKDTRNGHRQGAFPRAFAKHRITALVAKEAELAAERAENARLRIALASIANRINVEGSPWHDAQLALDKLVVEIKRKVRATLAETQP